MKTDIEYKNNILYVKIPSIFTKKVIAKFESMIIPIILDFNLKNISIDLSEVNHIDKRGVNSIIKLSEIVNKNNGRVQICELNNYIRDYLNNTDIFDYCIKPKEVIRV